MNEEKNESLQGSKNDRKTAAPFFAVLALLTVISFILPLRPSESLVEKRRLAQFPAFSADALWSGDYFDDISLWFSDTFPGRDLYISVASTLESAHGLNRNRVVNVVPSHAESDDLDALLDAVEATAAPLTEPVVTAAPEPTEDLAETVDPDAELSDWKGFDAEDELDMYGSMMVLGDTIVTSLSFSKTSSDRHVAMMNETGDALAGIGVRFFNLPAPTSVGVLMSSSMMEKLGCEDQGKMLRYMFAQENENVHKVNAFNYLIAHNDEYVYYRTDHHWSALGAYYAYEAFCREAGFEPVPLSEYEEVSMGEFLGTYYLQLNGRVKVKDELFAYVPPGETHMYTSRYPQFTSVIWDKSNDNASVKYNCFLGGDHPITILTNDSIPDAPNCVVLKDSFGNPFSVYLTQHYHQVVVMDFRNAGYSVMDMVKEYDASDVILVQSIGVSQNANALKQLRFALRND